MSKKCGWAAPVINVVLSNKFAGYPTHAASADETSAVPFTPAADSLLTAILTESSKMDIETFCRISMSQNIKNSQKTFSYGAVRLGTTTLGALVFLIQKNPNFLFL